MDGRQDQARAERFLTSLRNLCNLRIDALGNIQWIS
jgi:hypothetical protein